MLTSDQDVDGARYELVLTSPGREPITLHLSSEPLAELLHAWKELERRKDARLDVGPFLRDLMLHVLLGRHHESSINPVLSDTALP